MKKPLFLLIPDLHIEERTKEELISIIKQIIVECKNFGFLYVYQIGDVFDSRKSQSLKVLEAFTFILDMFHEAGIIVRAIPGNHDKPNYRQERSYLDLYKNHPGLELIRSHQSFEVGDYLVHMIPFFCEKTTFSTYLEIAIKEVKEHPNKEHILLTHIAIDGVMNNDGSKIEGHIPSKLFKLFKKVFIGHYHNFQVIDDYIIYIGSVRQNNFGEDKKKGVTVVYNTTEYEQIETMYKQYSIIKIDMNTITEKELVKLKDTHKESYDHVRFKFYGSSEKLKSLDRNTYEKIGIDVQFEEDEPQVDLSYADLSDFKGFNPESIKEGWDEFCELNSIEEDRKIKGRQELEKIL